MSMLATKTDTAAVAALASFLPGRRATRVVCR